MIRCTGPDGASKQNHEEHYRCLPEKQSFLEHGRHHEVKGINIEVQN